MGELSGRQRVPILSVSLGAKLAARFAESALFELNTLPDNPLQPCIHISLSV
ncbi:MAG: hypothetical protein M3P29_00150 [Acidobacteriota bacterium]|nr:hypothetical protein [Acidobacteriota bacterium]